jgi:hypothetical protein
MKENCVITAEMLEGASKFQDELDEAVHEAKAAEAARINNDGTDSQIAYLIEAIGVQNTADLLTE